MTSKFDNGDPIVSFNGKWVTWAHTISAAIAFFSALMAGVYLHYNKIVSNQYYGYPQEWFPSVSATIGDRYPERSLFQIFIAVTSGPRFALVLLFYILSRRPNYWVPEFVVSIGLFRTLMCGGWTYVTSTDDHDWHDICMISYIAATIPWTSGCFKLGSRTPTAKKYRKIFSGLFFGAMFPMIYFYIQHKIYAVPGAYTTYAFFEWTLVSSDVAFDAVTAIEFSELEIVIQDIKDSTAVTNDVTAITDDMMGDPETIDEYIPQETAYTDDRLFFTRVVDASADVVSGYVFWTLLSSLLMMIWYFPLWKMGISGYEISLLFCLAPFIMMDRGIQSFFVNSPRLAHFLSLSGLLAYRVSNPALRLFVVGFAVGMGIIAWAVTWYRERCYPSRLESRILSWLIGLVACNVCKFAFYSNNPAWPIFNETNGGWNKEIITVSIIAAMRSTRSVNSDSRPFVRLSGKKGSPTVAGMAFGSLVFAMHLLLQDSSTMISWVWDGHPVRGPIAIHGPCTLLAMGAGVLLGVFYPRFAGSWTMYGIGAMGVTVLMRNHHWFGYCGALVTAVYLMAVAPVLISSAVRYSPGLTFGTAFLCYIFCALFHVWVVAYAFVPGGRLVREHTDWLIMSIMGMIAAGLFSASDTDYSNSVSSCLLTAGKGKKARFIYLYPLAALQLLGLSISYLRFSTYDYVPYHQNERLITAGIWTIHFSLDNHMWSSETRIRDMMRELELDVAGFLETDCQKPIMGNRDTSQYFAEHLGMYVDYGPGPNKHTWGCTLLSKFPILNSTHHLLPSPMGELAPAIHATLDAYGELVDIVVFHSGQKEDIEDRRLQAEYLSKLMGSSNRPMILLSYLVTLPYTGTYNTYVSDVSGMQDIEPGDWDRWCEYILYKGLRRTGYARISHGTITDTEIQVGKFIVGAEDATELVEEDRLPPALRFPSRFRGMGVRGHRYHVFNEPLYYD